MAIPIADVADVTERLDRDLRNSGMASWVQYIARNCRNALYYYDNPARLPEAADARDFIEKVVEDVQQDILDSIIVWPVCPHHPNHPLWFHDGGWYCEQNQVLV